MPRSPLLSCSPRVCLLPLSHKTWLRLGVNAVSVQGWVMERGEASAGAVGCLCRQEGCGRGQGQEWQVIWDRTRLQAPVSLPARWTAPCQPRTTSALLYPRPMCCCGMQSPAGIPTARCGSHRSPGLAAGARGWGCPSRSEPGGVLPRTTPPPPALQPPNIEAPAWG